MTSGKYGEVEEVDMDSTPKIWDYHVKIPSSLGDYTYDWRVFEKDGLYTLKRFDWLSSMVFYDGVGGDFGTLDEAIQYADTYSESYTNDAVSSLTSMFGASTKKSKNVPKFSDMVKNQRTKNNAVKKDGYINDDEENEWLWGIQDFYRILIPKIERTAQKLTTIMGRVITYDNNGQFSGSEGHEIQDAIDAMRELLDNLENKIIE